MSITEILVFLLAIWALDLILNKLVKLIKSKKKNPAPSLVGRGLGFNLDWKWIPSDILFEVEKIVPGFSYKVIKESSPYEKKISFKGEIDGEKVEFDTPRDKPIKFIERINPIIVKLKGKKFIEVETDGDYYCFILKAA